MFWVEKKWVASLKKWINAIVFMKIIPFHTSHWKKTTIATSSYFSLFFPVGVLQAQKEALLPLLKHHLAPFSSLRAA